VTSAANISGAVAGDDVEYIPWDLNDKDQLISEGASDIRT
jgi:hypothetical protein